MTEQQMKRKERLEILITRGYTGDIDTGKIYNRFGKEVLTTETNGYLKITTIIDKKTINCQQHQFIYYLATGEVVEQLDHINGIRTDNRINNLRPVTKNQNQFNKKNVKGYTFCNKMNKWKAYIKIDNKLIHLGYYSKEDWARQAYLDAKEIYHVI